MVATPLEAVRIIGRQLRLPLLQLGLPVGNWQLLQLLDGSAHSPVKCYSMNRGSFLNWPRWERHPSETGNDSTALCCVPYSLH